MRDGGQLRALVCGSLLATLGCDVAHDEVWQLVSGLTRDQHQKPGTPPPAQPPIDPRIDQDCLQQQLTPYVQSVGAGWPQAFQPTGTLLVSASGQQLYSLSVGASDWEQNRLATPHTSFRVGSITKSFTAVAILQLAEAGLLTVEDTIGQHLPEYPAPGSGITLHQLLTHTAGLPNYTNDAELMARRDQPITPEELLASFWAEPLEFEPGTQFRYSNSGYVVLGAIIERITGVSYAEYMQRAVFEPAGLTRTIVGDAEGLSDRALGYTSDLLGELVPAFPIDMTVPHAAGAIRSTAADLARYHSVLSTDVLLDAESRQQLITPFLEGYAYGWQIEQQDALQVVRHGGAIDGFLSDFVRVPELDLAVVVLLNSDSVNPSPIADAALSCALGHDIPPAPPPPVAQLDTAQRQSLLGTYQLSEQARQQLEALGLTGSALEALATAGIYEVDGAFVFQLVGQGPVLMLPLSEREALLPAVAAQLHFGFAEAEPQATSVTIEQGGLTFLYER